MMPLSNILDPIQPTLPPHVWEHPDAPEPTLKPVHAHFVTKQIYAILERGGYHDPHRWLDLFFTGSLCTYQYGPNSDADISLFVNSHNLPEWSRAEMIGLMIEGTEGVTLPGTTYELQAYVVAKKLHPADLYKPGLRAGYNIGAHHWIQAPDRLAAHDVEAQENGFYVWALQQADKMERLLRYEPDKAVKFWRQIHHKRMRDQMAGKGDHSESNILYKFLAHRGLLPQIAEVSGEHIARQGAWQDHFVNQIHPIADAYDALPTYDQNAAGAWRELAADSTQRANELRNRFNISETDNPEPYANAQAMFHDLNRGNFAVSRANTEHPIWTPEQDVDFRIVHDIMGHHASGGDFSWQGENHACGAHFPLLTPNAQRALMTECLGQTGAAIRNGGFGPQKVGFMDPAIGPAQQLYNQGTFSAMPSGGYCHRHLRHGIHRLRTAAWTGPGDVNLTTQPPQHPMQEGPSPFANVNQWQINVGNPDRYQLADETIRKMMFAHHPDVPFQIQRGQGGWQGQPEESLALHLYATPHQAMKSVAETLGQYFPNEQYFAIIPQGGESSLWANPSYRG